MSRTGCDSSLLTRDGTSQQQRLLKSLLPGYVAVDERSFDDLKNFVINFAKEIQYYDKNNSKTGNWENFFKAKVKDTSNRYTEPHYALFLAFLKLFKYAQNDLNKITKKHIDFYYRDVLQLQEREAVADQVFVVFELAKHVSTFLIKKGTKLKAGKDATGVELSYEVDKDIVVNKATVEELKALYIDRSEGDENNPPYIRVYESPTANSANGKGKELETEDKSWNTFGVVKPDSPDRDLADIGFGFASPMFYLAEGERIVTITLNIQDPSKNRSKLRKITEITDYDLALRAKFSGEKEWIESIYEGCKSTGNEVCGPVLDRVLEFINSAQKPEDIAGIEPQEGPVYDDPTKGYGDQIRDYDIGLTVARRIINDRNALDPPEFTTKEQLMKVRGFGIDKMNDLAYTFRQKYHFIKVDPVKGQIIIRRTLDRSQDAVVGYNKKNLTDPFNTTWPVVKLLLNTKSNVSAQVYALLKDIKIKSAEINVNVSDVTSLIIQNDFAVLDPSKPVQAFTNKPIQGSNFYIGNWEAFQKKPDYVDLNFSWVDIPQDATGFAGYFTNYNDLPNSTKRNNDSFKINISHLNGKKWKRIKSDSNLFTDKDGKSVANSTALPGSEQVVKLKLIDKNQLHGIEREISPDTFEEYDNSLLSGFMKLSFTGYDFGHSTYQQEYSQAILGSINFTTGEVDLSSLPNPPYTPTLSNISLSYSSTGKILFKSLPVKKDEKVTDQFFHIHPFGVRDIKNTESSYGIMPKYDNEGELLIGVKNLVSLQSLALLLKISESSSGSGYIKPQLTWSYLSDNDWKPFGKTQVTADTTNNMLVSGIVNLSIPKDATSSNSIVTSGLHWVKVSCIANISAVPYLIDVKAQAVSASFKNNNNDPNHLANALAEKTIAKLKKSESSIKSISQPYASFGGRTTEQSESFYKRTSERLRHKNRAITIWDFERLILEEFNKIYKVKCLNHTNISLKPFNPVSPGIISIIVVPDVQGRIDVDPMKPMANQGTLVQISDFIKKKSTTSAEIYVDNPIYEEIKVEFQVKFKTEDVGYYLNKLNEDIKEFLAPWAYQSESEVVFGGRVHKSVIINFIEELNYVDYIRLFKMKRSNPLQGTNSFTGDIDEAVASTSASVLTSAKKHDISPVEEESCTFEGNINESKKYGDIKSCLE